VTRLTDRAEEALLGSALRRPESLSSLRWIPPGTFSRPDHAALWKTLHGIDFSRVEYKDIPVAVDKAVQQIEDQGIRHSLSPSQIMQLAAVCPDPRNALLYGGMTLEAAVHRAVEHAGGQLRETARQAEVEQARKALEQAERTKARLHSLDQAWQQAPETVRNLLDTPPDATEQLQLAERGERARVDLQAEGQAIASLLYQPGQLADVTGWLKPHDFSHPELAAVYGAMVTLDQRHAPVDPLTVSWEAARHPGAQPSEQLLAELEQAGIGGVAAWHAERVMNTAALDHLDAAGHDIRNLARHPSLAPSALVDHAEQALEPVLDDGPRLERAAREPEMTPADKEPAPAEHAVPGSAAPTHDHEMEM
jgi:replicative DNA helicase